MSKLFSEKSCNRVHVGGFASGLPCAAMLLPQMTAEEREMFSSVN